MRVKKRTVTETVTDRVVWVRARSCRHYCPACGRTAGMLPIEDVAEALGISVSSLRKRVVGGEPHFVDASGVHWVCQEWLSKSPGGELADPWARAPGSTSDL